MELAFEGWQYVNILFNHLYQCTTKYRKGHLVSPRYIFRGITQRHFTSSSLIDELLKSDSTLFNEHKEYVEKKENRTIDKNPSFTDLLKIQKSYYTKSKHALNAYITDLVKTKEDSNILLQSIITHKLYKYVMPLYIRSGAAVRLFCQQNRTQNDYVNYLRNLISEAKSRYPEAYSEFSDLEILADIQHKGGASCLVDFSTNFLVALWFATQDYAHTEDGELGYLLCYDVNTDAIEEDNLTILNKDKERNKIEDLILETSKLTKFNGIESFKFWLWKPSNLNSRIARQDSIFIFGIEKFLISQHPVFLLPIPFEWKKPIQHVLKDFFGIYGETIYADSAGLSSTNTKLDPLKTQTQYFTDITLDASGLEDQTSKSIANFEMFQKGTSALLKAHYDIALNYFCAFEGSNYDIINQIKGETPYPDKIAMLLVELYYSKGMCMRHNKTFADAITQYKIALYKNIDIIIKHGYEHSQYCHETASVQDIALKRYASNKLFKILEDYMGLLYDMKYFYDAYEELKNILKLFQDNKITLSSEMRLLINTSCNEVKILAELYSSPRFNSIKFIDISQYTDEAIYPFCKVLNSYFKCIEEILNFKISSYFIENSKKISDLKELIKQAISSQGLSSETASIFTAWDLIDIKTAIDTQLKEKPLIRKSMRYVTSLVEDCQKQIDGRKRTEIY